jgi:predicted phosphodiesterase
VRLAVLSDVHANLQALQACLEVSARAGVEAHVCAGDLVGWGAQPVECVALLREIGAVCVAGNHDLAATGGLAAPRGTPAALESMRRTASQLDEPTRAFLAALPRTARLPGVVLAHGSPADPEEYVRAPGRADALLDAVEPGTVLVLGHTHDPWVHARRSGTLHKRRPGRVRLPAGEAVLVNPGSVGQSRMRSPDARLAVLDTDARTVELLAVPYDVDGCAHALRVAGLPERTFHTPLPLRHRLRTRAIDGRSALRRRLGRT